MGSILVTSECGCTESHLVLPHEPFVRHTFNSSLSHACRWFSIVMYLPFLFAVIVVLLNLLIAQMSDTYGRIQGDVESTFAIERARIIAKALKLNILCFQVMNCMCSDTVVCSLE